MMWINYIAAMLVGPALLFLHLWWAKPKSQSESYDLAGLITDPPSSEPEKPVRSFANIRSIDDVELSIEDIRECLLQARDLAKPPASRRSRALSLEKSEASVVALDEQQILESINTPAVKVPAKKAVAEQSSTPKPSKKETKKPEIAPAKQRSKENNKQQPRKRVVRNLDAALDIRSRDRRYGR